MNVLTGQWNLDIFYEYYNEWMVYCEEVWNTFDWENQNGVLPHTVIVFPWHPDCINSQSYGMQFEDCTTMTFYENGVFDFVTEPIKNYINYYYTGDWGDCANLELEAFWDGSWMCDNSGWNC